MINTQFAKSFILVHDSVNKNLIKCPLNWKIAFKVSELYVFRIFFMFTFYIKDKNFYDLGIWFEITKEKLLFENFQKSLLENKKNLENSKKSGKSSKIYTKEL